MYRIIGVLSDSGYHGTRHLQAMIRIDSERRADIEYGMTVLWSIGKMLGSEQYSIPAYSEYKHPVSQDNRSGEAILNSLKYKLKGGGV